MGTSTDAILCYGININENYLADCEEDTGELDESWAKENGSKLIRWMLYYGESVNGVKIITHCSDEYPMYLLVAEGSDVTAWRGYPKKINSIDPNLNWNNLIANFVEENNVQTDGEIGWWLCSYWG